MTIADQIRQDIDALITGHLTADQILDGWVDHISEVADRAAEDDSDGILEDARLALAAEPAPLHRVLQYLAKHPGLQGAA